MLLNNPVTDLKQIGPQRAEKLEAMGIITLRDLIEYFPRTYEDHSQIKKIGELELEQTETFYGRISLMPENVRWGRMVITKTKAEDETGTVPLVWYNQGYMKNNLQVGQTYLFTGKLKKNKQGRKEISNPAYERPEGGVFSSGGRIIPVYTLPSGVSQKFFRSWIEAALHEIYDVLYDFMPLEIKKEYQLCDRSYAIENIHFPKDRESFFLARKRLVFEELFLLQLALFRLKSRTEEGKEGIRLQNSHGEDALLQVLPFSLTQAQKRVLEEIKKDMTSGKTMNRLVQGDVGSGKTAVAMAAAFLVIQNGYQSALMAPTEVLAQQHFETFQAYFAPFQIETVLLTGSMTKKERQLALEKILSGEASMIIGTHAVIQEAVRFHNLGLVVTDEQHRFGVRQRSQFMEKGDNPHVLVMTATPIPRTLALILYGDLDISVIDQLPPGRQEIQTIPVTSQYRQRIYRFIEKEIQKGRQAYIVCPMIEESSSVEAEDAVGYAEKLRLEVFPDFQIGCLHGKMKPKEKQEIMEGFSQGKIQILVSTTVIEVGIHVANATIMLIENAERFGLAQLHQLRGRVGRGNEKSYCILICDSKGKVARQRMKTMKETTDGFVISEMDLKLRGPGEFFGTKQHGLPELKIANLYQDMAILKEAQTAAQKIYAMDPKLLEEEHILLRKEYSALYGAHSIGI